MTARVFFRPTVGISIRVRFGWETSAPRAGVLAGNFSFLIQRQFSRGAAGLLALMPRLCLSSLSLSLSILSLSLRTLFFRSPFLLPTFLLCPFAYFPRRASLHGRSTEEKSLSTLLISGRLLFPFSYRLKRFFMPIFLYIYSFTTLFLLYRKMTFHQISTSSSTIITFLSPFNQEHHIIIVI